MVRYNYHNTICTLHIKVWITKVGTLFPNQDWLIALYCEEARQGFHGACTHTPTSWFRGLSNTLRALRCFCAGFFQVFESRQRIHGHVRLLSPHLQASWQLQSPHLAWPLCIQCLRHPSQLCCHRPSSPAPANDCTSAHAHWYNYMRESSLKYFPGRVWTTAHDIDQHLVTNYWV